MEHKIGYSDLNTDMKIAVIGSYVYIFFLLLGIGILGITTLYYMFI